MSDLDVNLSELSMIYPGVVWEGRHSVGAFSIIGQPFHGEGSTETRIGDNA